MEKDSPETNCQIYTQTIFAKSTKTIERDKEQCLQQMVLGKLDIHKHENGNSIFA